MYKSLQSIDNFGNLIWETMRCLPYIWEDRQKIALQIEKIGVDAIPVVSVMGVFTGTIIAWQAAYQARGFAPLDMLGGQILRSIMMEMAPILTGIVMCGRVGASITAEISAMKVSEQIDALVVMSIDPIRYLVFPRWIALMVMMPVLVIFAMASAGVGAVFVSSMFLNIHYTIFLNSIHYTFQPADLMGGVIKSIFFGIIIAFVGCYKGLFLSNTKIGEATVSSFVNSTLIVLISDFLLWIILF